MIKQEWVCGHFSTAMCAECYGELARRANKLAENIFELNSEIERMREHTRLDQSLIADLLLEKKQHVALIERLRAEIELVSK